MCFFCGKKDEPKNLHKCQTLELYNLNNFNLIATLSDRDMVAIDAKYHLNCLTLLYRPEKKINSTHCDEPVDEQIMNGTLVFRFCNSAFTKFEFSTLTNPAPELIITTLLFQMLLLNFFLTYNILARIS